jgi:hypothetical protein
MRRRLGVTVLVAGLAVGGLLASLSGAGTKTETTVVGGGESDSVTARCKQGQRVVAAGARGEAGDIVMKGQGLVVLGEVARPGKRRARAAGRNIGGQDADLTAIARCKRQPRSKLASETITVAPQGMDVVVESVTTACPPGKRIVFGGFRAEQRSEPGPGPIILPTAARRTGPRNWTVEGYNLADGPNDAGELTALAYCGDVKTTQARTKTVSTGTSDVGTAKARCPRGDKLRYGGFDGTNPEEAMALSMVTEFRRTNSRTFRVSHLAFAGAADLTAIAYCR